MSLRLQEVIHKYEVGAGTRALKLIVGIVAIVALALLYDMAAFRNFSNPEAMDAAQLARNISQGQGFTTDYVRPFSIALLRRHSISSGAGTNALQAAVEKSPDISNPPVYPVLLAGALKLMPFQFPDLRGIKSFTTYSPELWIAGLNQFLFLISVCLTFALGRRLFDESVAWVSAAVLAATELFWRHSISGLPTLWLTTLVLLLALVLVRLDTAARDPATTNQRAIFSAAVAGLLVGVIGLTRYACLALIVPVVAYLITVPTRQRVGMALAAALVFLGVVVPWLARNYSTSGTVFGTAAYTVLQDTPQFPADTLMRSSSADFSTVSTSDVNRKIIVNLRDVVMKEVPRLGGSWVAALFLAGLLMPFRNAVTARARWFVVGVLGVLLFAQAAVSPSAQETSVEVNAADYLILAGPLVYLFGVSLLFVLLEQFPGLGARYAVLAVFFVVACAPLALTFAAPPPSPIVYPPYYPPWIQAKARWVPDGEWVMSDVPWALAWYGDRKSVALSLKHGNAADSSANDFYAIHQIKPLSGLHLTDRSFRTLDPDSIVRWRQAEAVDRDWETFRARLKAVSDTVSSGQHNPAAMDSLMEIYSLAEKHWVRGAGEDWDAFILGIFVAREVPTGFPLKMAPEGLIPEIFLTDSERSDEKVIKPPEQTQKP